MNVLSAIFLLSLQAWSVISFSASVPASSVTAVQDSSSVDKLNATCPFRTINYITQSLPQQCLTSSWQSATTSTPDIARETAGKGIPHASSGGRLNSTTGDATQQVSTAAVNVPSHAPSESSSEKSNAAVLEAEDASPLEGEKFMSFEEWKKQNLKKAGQSEHIGKDKPEYQAEPRIPVNVHSALDSLGDDAEIDLDFSGFIPNGPELARSSIPSQSSDAQQSQSESQASVLPSVRSRSKDAGTTCKERFNYASFDCAADILKTNPEAKSPNAVLGENKDHYMLNVCSANNKYLIIKLCDDISIDTIVLANFEFFSSIFRTFRVSVSDKYPVKTEKWKSIGVFEARNTRDVQAFLVEHPIIWARYLRIDFLSHYGSEYYCPVSLIRVHGTTMLEDYKRDAEALLPPEDDDNEASEPGSSAEGVGVSEAVSEPLLQEMRHDLESLPPETASRILATEYRSAYSAAIDPIASSTRTVTERTPETSKNTRAGSYLLHSPRTPDICTQATPIQLGVSSESSDIPDQTQTLMPTSSHKADSEHMPVSSDTMADRGSVANSTSADQSPRPKDRKPPQTASFNTTHASLVANATDRQKATPSSTQSHAATPTMQESFFKSVQKRLQMLEANSSLSLQYIEDQSRALRDAFNRVEQRQLTKTTTFLDYLNTTVLNELRDFRQQYDQLWQSTVIELQVQRERYQQENAAINARLGILADELIFQKRLSILQMTLILVCLGLVLFAKGTLNHYLEHPMVQKVLARSPSNRWLNFTALDTPTQSPPPTRQNSLWRRQGILKGHRRLNSEDSIDDGGMSPSDDHPSPPPAMEYEVGTGADHENETGPVLDSPEFDPRTIERPSTSPPVLPSETPSLADANDVVLAEGIDARIVDTGLNSPPPSPEIHRDITLPCLTIEEATPERSLKQLSWKLSSS